MSPFDLPGQMRVFETWHTDARNRACHDLGIPLVTLAALGALASVRLGIVVPWFGALDLGLLLLALTFIFDLWLQWRLAPLVLFLGLGLWWVGAQLSGPALAAVFVAGWFFQLLGHRGFEGNRPAFTDNLVHLVVGPRWLVDRWSRITNVWLNDLLRSLTLSVVPWAARRFERQFDARIDGFKEEQDRLRGLYGVQPMTPIRGYDEVTRAAVQAYAGRHPEVRLAYTSGSTSAPKALAYPPERLRSFKAASRSVGFRAWATVGIRAPSIFVLSSLADDSSFTSLAVYQRHGPDRLTGLIEPARYLFTEPLRRCIEAYGATAARAWLMALSNPGLIYSTNPSTLAVFLNELHEDWPRSTQMIRDYQSGTGTAAQPELRRIARRIETWGSAQRLAMLACAEGPVEMGAMMPGLSAYCCWDGGYVRSFLKQIRRWLPEDGYTHVPMFAMSTETIETLTWFGPDGQMRYLPLGPGVLYEFVREDAPDDPAQLMLPHELEPGRAYAMVVSDPYGLLRYQTEDLFQCEGRVRGVPDLRFLRRRGLTWSFTGEKLTGEQLFEAYAALERKVPALSQLSAQMTTLPSWPEGAQVPHYHLMVAHSHEGEELDLCEEEIAQHLDGLLCAANSEYADKRSSGRLEGPRAQIIAYSALAQALDASRTGETPGAMRAWESQFKLTPLTRRKLQDVAALTEES